ncbi:MAG: hypothetical protein BMS9Abin37_0002 [Acidobacteriota bacterium]|nr:MAG: hypothetical protein BMS9Abin37_0002 [Acidobacteriota bacterium]
MLRVYYSNRTEELLEALIERIGHQRAERSTLYDPVHIVVPNRNLKTYLELSLARLTGICANVHFHTSHELFRRPSTLANRVLTALFTDELLDNAELEPVRTYLEAGGDEQQEVDRRRVQLARELARLYADYESYRPEFLDCWRAGLFIGETDSRDVETWQRRLWLELSEASDDNDIMGEVPAPLHVFGVSYMPRAHIDLLGRIAGDVYLYTLNPCQEIWEAISAPISRSARRYERRGKDLGPGEVFSVDDPFRLANAGEMLPLRLWGRTGRESLRITNALTGCELVPRIKGPEPGSLLEQFQRDIALRKPERKSIPKDFDFENDDSIVVVECASVRRELEAIGSEIWRLLALDKSDEPLRFNDIAVILAPAVAERYQALIGSVFGEMHALPHNMVDLPLRSESRLSEAVELLLEIPSSGFSRKEIMGFVTHPTVIGSFPDASRDDWLAWCDALGIVRGIDRHDRDDTYVEKDVFNWDQGLKRLALGAFMSGEQSGDDRLFRQGNDTYLAEEIPLDKLSSAGSFGLFVRSLLSDAREAARVHMTVPAWMDFMSAFITSYVAPHPYAPSHSPPHSLPHLLEDERVLRKCLRAVSSLADMNLGGKKVSYAVAHELVRAELGALSGSRGQYLVDGVVVSSFLPMRAIPFKVIFIAGLGGGHFPAPERRDHLDLRHVQRRAGDVSKRERDKYLFLETLLSTRERLYLSYVARDELTGATLQPSSVVLELVEALEQGYVREILRRRYPLRRVDDPVSWRTSPRAARERNACALGENLRTHLGRSTLPEVGKLDLGPRVQEVLKAVAPPASGKLAGDVIDMGGSVSVAAIRRFLECPLQGSARFALRLGDSPEEDPLSREDELFHAGALERALLLRETFRRGGDATSYDELAHRFELRGERPTGLFGDAERERHLRILESWHKSLSEVAGTDGENGKDLALSTREPASFALDGARIELGPSSLLFLASPRIAIRLCAQHRSRFHPRRESLHGFLDHVFHAAAGLTLGEPYAFVAINALPDEEKHHFERFTFAPISREAATRYLVALVEDMRRGVHDYLLPCEVALNDLEPLPPPRTSSRFGPILHPEDYDPPGEPRAREIVERRFGLYFESLGQNWEKSG